MKPLTTMVTSAFDEIDRIMASLRTAMDVATQPVDQVLEPEIIEPEAIDHPAIIEDEDDDAIILDDFGKSSESHWTIKHGHNDAIETTFGAVVDLGDPQDTLKVEYSRHGSSHGSQVSYERSLTPHASWKGAESMKLELAVDKDVSWWMRMYITAGGHTYEKVIKPYEYISGQMQNRIIKFAELSSHLKPDEITHVKLLTVGQRANTLYLNKLSLVRPESITPSVKFSTSADNNTFRPNSIVKLNFEVSTIFSKATALKYVVTDYFGATVDHGTINLHGGKTYSVIAKGVETGYYDVVAYWLDRHGEYLEKRSCIKKRGSLKQRKGTYAVVANSAAASKSLIDSVGHHAFFGLHLSSHGLDKLVGVDWSLEAPKWKHVEPTKPPYRHDGTTSWSRKLLQEPQGKHSAKAFRLLRLNHYRDMPSWARSHQSDPAPALKNVNDFIKYFTNQIKVHKHQYPGMPHRIYDVLWEVNLNDPDSIQSPKWLPADIVDMYRRAKAILATEDRGAVLAGPASSSYIKDMGWVKKVIDAGVLHYIDAYHGHGYNSAPPETGGVREKTRELKALFAAHGKPDVPIYITELGYRSQFGSLDMQSLQAKLHVRCAVILKGEGVTVYTPFFAYDFIGDTNSWGFNYNLDHDIGYGPSKISPKAIVPAYSVCVKKLEGKEPIRDITTYGEDVWAYVFGKRHPVIVIWKIGGSQIVDVSVGDVVTVVVTDMMGHESTKHVHHGKVSLHLTDAPVYINGAKP